MSVSPPDDEALIQEVHRLEGLGHGEWVLAAKSLLASWRPTVAIAERILGTTKHGPNSGVGSSWLTPRDHRFRAVTVSPSCQDDDGGSPVSGIRLAGETFLVRPCDLTADLPLLESAYNTWDGGMFFFFGPLLPNPSSLYGIQLDAYEGDAIYGDNALGSPCRAVSFVFGTKASRYRDGIGCS